MCTTEQPPSLLADDRGAIMVMGIFMCSCLVAALWYLAGIGDAIIYRERMQEAADAIAFSDAALHARGMNLLVLLNLVMAVILSIRVVLRVGKLVLAVAAAVFAGLGFVNPALWAAAPPTATTAVTLDTIDNSAKPAIDGALTALVGAQKAVAQGTPLLAHGAVKLTVGEKYGPVVKRSGSIEPGGLGGPLPVDLGTPDKLCREAAGALPKMQSFILKKFGGAPIAAATSFLAPLMEALVGTSSQYFCDLEAGASQPSTENEFDKAADARCRDPVNAAKQELTHFLDAEKAWENGCAAAGVACQSRDGKGDPLPKGVQFGRASDRSVQHDLERLLLERDQNARSLQNPELSGKVLTDPKKCTEAAKADMKQRQSEQDALNKGQNKQNDPHGNSPNGNSGTSQGSPGIAPMSIKGFRNGSKEGQFIGAVLGDDTRLQKDSHLVRIGAFNAKKTPAQVDPPNATLPAWAQAEMFYDCASKWDTCNGDDEAMWHFKWRARLRRFNQDTSATFQNLAVELVFAPPRTGPDAFADRLAHDALAPGVAFSSNRALRADLSKLILEPTTRTQGVH